MKKGDMVCSKDHSIVGVIIDESTTFNTLTLAVLWNEPPTAQGCKTFIIYKDNIEPLPRGTIIRQILDNGKCLECKYDRYDSKRNVIYDKEGENNLCVACKAQYDIIFVEDVSTKNNKQYTCLPIEPWDIMEKDFTREEFIGFLKGNCIKYLLRKKGSDLQDFEKVEHYAKKLQEVLRNESC